MAGRKYRRIYEEHYGPIPKGYHVHHKDFNHNNDNPENLEALLPDDHAMKHGFLSNFIMSQARATDLARLRNLGRKHTTEWITEAKKRMLGNTFRLGKRHTEEFKKRKSSQMLGKRYALGNRFKRNIEPESMCPHCKYISRSAGNMKRWHFDACRERVF